MKFLDILNSISFVIAPPTCILCGSIIQHNGLKSEHICDDCWQQVPKPKSSSEILERIDKHFGVERNPFSFAFALFDSEGDHKYLKIIHYLKYFKFIKIGYFCGRILGEYIHFELKSKEFFVDFVVPVPIHYARKRERGFNQAEIIGEAISKATGIPLKKEIIQRVVYTKSQTELTLDERMENVSGVFQLVCDSSMVRDKNIILVDDVITTGSTLYHCGKLLKENGAKNLMFAVLTTA